VTRVQNRFAAGRNVGMKIAAILAVLAAVVSSTAVAATTRAKVAVVSTTPMKIGGTGFRSRERVTVTLTTTGVYRKVVRATARGAFSARFAGVSIGYCEGYSVRAKGNRGSVAVIKLIPECPSG
jgi:hypothetical protein